MAKKRKPGAKATSTKRAPRRGKNDKDAASESIDGETSSTPTPQVDDQQPSTASTGVNCDASNTDKTQSTSLESEDHIPKPVLVPKLHKKFGKYRCLFTNEDSSKKIELGSDSETNSSIDKVIDICTGSESDSNASTSLLSTVSPLRIDSKSTDVEEQKFPTIIENKLETSLEIPQEIPLPSIEKMTSSMCSSELLAQLEQLNNREREKHTDSTLTEDQVDDYDNNDDDVITVVQILEDDNPELFYSIQMGSPTTESPNEPSQVVSQFQNEFQKLNLTGQNTSTKMECSDSSDNTTCVTLDLFPKDLSESLSRPDPSITPNSTISDDSNSSRITLEQNQNNSNDSAESSPTSVRRSTRIKTISNLKQKTKGYGLVKTPLKKALLSQTKLKLEELSIDSLDKPAELSSNSGTNSPTFPVPIDMPVKVKSRWRRSSELEMVNSPSNSPLASPSLPKLPLLAELPEEVPEVKISKEDYDRIIKERMDQFVHLEENEYLCERMISRDTKKMICDCFLTKEEMERGEYGCGEDCLNRLLMIECNYRCPVGDRCTNRRFQKRENSNLNVFYADKKGCGVEAGSEIQPCEFLMEYVGEVLDYDQFYKRAQSYSDENNLHHYFMSLKGDTVIDATMKGNISRFINHSCDPNAETQKWTVNGELRIGFFSKREIKPGEEITFDYQFQRFGKIAQRCYCGADNCRGWIGGEPDSDEDEYEDEDDVSTSKSGESVVLESPGVEGAVRPPRRRRPKRERRTKTQDADADIEDDIESLSRSGIKNQSHTLLLSRTMVRVKSRPAQTWLLRLLRDADVPCRRLFLDYRGLRLLAPWCSLAPLDFRLEMLQTVDRLPIPNKTMVQESRFFTIVERWLNSNDVPVEPLTLIDEATGLPAELPNQTVQDVEKIKENTAALQKVKELSKQLIERWSSLKEVFKIPKKERIQQMKEHERQANVERRAADSSGSRDRDRNERKDRDKERERDRDKYRERERDRERERERDRERDERDRRKRRSSPDGRRSLRVNERVLSAVPPMSKEERRRAFAEAALKADLQRRESPAPGHWYYNGELYQMYPPGMIPPGLPPNMQSGIPPGMPQLPPGMQQMPPNMPQLPPGMQQIPPGMQQMPPGMQQMPAGMQQMPPGMQHLPPSMQQMPPGIMQTEMPPDWIPPEFQGAPGFFPGQPFCMPQPNFMNMGGFPGGFMFPQQPFPPEIQIQPQSVPDNSVQQPPLPAKFPPGKIVLPALWRSHRDPLGRTYYYHVKLRVPQWLPPPPPHHVPEESSSEEEEEVDPSSAVMKKQTMGKLVEGVNGVYEVIKEDQPNGLIPEHALTVKPKKRRPGLVTERPISPRTEEDKLAGRLEIKRYKETKEKLRRRREKLLRKVRVLQTSSKRSKKDKEITPQELQMIDLESDSDSISDSPDQPEVEPEPEIPVEPAPEVTNEVENEEVTRKIKETFRSSMARVMVHHLNPYRHRTASFGRITCTADFKHLARKLTHFVMLKELKHCRSVDELVVTDSVKTKAKEFVKKYMVKFGPVYKRPVDEAD